MRTVKKCCPKCHAAYYTESLFAFSVPWDYGSPLVVCKECGEKFWDCERVEIASCGYHKSHARLFSAGSLLLSAVLGGCSYLFFSLDFDVENVGGWFFACCAALVLIIKAATFKKRKAKLAEETQKSIERFRDPHYVAFLKSKFYPTTDKFIERK